MRNRKPILIVDDSPLSQKIIDLFKNNEIEFVKYHIKKFEESCCGELPTTKAPSVIAAEGIFKEESHILNYINYTKQKNCELIRDCEKDSSLKQKNQGLDETDSAYW